MARRKFSVYAEINRGVQRFKHQLGSEWSFVPDKAICKQMTNDFLQKKLYVRGQEFDIPWSRKEVLNYITILPKPEIKDLPTGKRLHSTPLFYLKSATPFTFSHSFRSHSRIHYVAPSNSTRDMLAQYTRAENYHKTQEGHHPDGLGWSGGMAATVECVFDVFNSLLREFPLHHAYERLLLVLLTDKFANLSPSGIYAALLHIIIRGVAFTEQLRTSSVWRRAQSQQRLMYLHLLFKQGGANPTSNLALAQLIENYHSELVMHRISVEQELKLLRIGGHHDHTKFQRDLKWWYAWYWGVYQQASEVNRYRMLSDKTTTVEEVFEGRETMLSMAGASFAKGVAESQELKSTIKEVAHEVISESTTQMRQEIKEEFKEITDEAHSILRAAFSDAKEISSETISKTSTVVEKLTNSLDSITSMMDSIKNMASGFLQSCMSSFKALPGMSDIKINLDTILAAIRDWIMYINVDSSVLKSILIISMLNNLGLLKSGFHFLMGLWDYVKDIQKPKATVEGEEVIAEETSFNSIFSFMSLSITNLIQIVAGISASLVKGCLITAEEFWSMCEHLAKNLKTVHFIGAGLMGFSRIFDFVSKIFSAISDWISRHLFKKTPELEVLARKVMIWIVKVKYFSTEAGLDAIRLNRKMRDIATALHAEYLALSVQCREKKEYRVLLSDLERYKKQITDVYDYITRLEAVSNFCPTMFHIQFVGEPGVGKSFLFKTFVDNIATTLWPDEKDSSFYSYNPNLEFFDGYAGQKIFYIDDCFRMQEPKHLTQLIGLITNTPVILPMANLSDKGTQLTSDVMISSTNTAWPIGKDVLCMEAVHRRRHMLVEVQIDPRVRDQSTGAFSMNLYKKYYKEEDLPKFPHLTFNMLRPVPKDLEDHNKYQKDDSDAFLELQQYAEKLKEANIRIMTPGAEKLDELTDPQYFFSKENEPPEGIKLPCTSWTYEQMVHNFIVRYRAFRGLERTYSTQRKYMHAERAIFETESLFLQSEDVLTEDASFLPKSKLVEKWFSDVHHPYGASDPIGEKIAQSPNSDQIPDLDNVDFEKIVDDILLEKKETMLSVEQETAVLKAIRNRMTRLRETQPAAIRNALHLTTVITEGKTTTYMPLKEDFTVWDNYSHVQSKSSIGYFKRNWESHQLMDLYNTFMRDMAYNQGNGFLKSFWNSATSGLKFRNEMIKFIYGAPSYYPDSDVFGDKRKQKSSFPLFFLQRLEKRFGVWTLDVSDLDQFDKFKFEQQIKYAPKAHVKSGDGWHQVPIDTAFLFSLSDCFRTFVREFYSLTEEQQEMIVQDAKWRNIFTGRYTLASIRESCKSTLLSGCVRAVEFLLAPIHFLFHKAPFIMEWAAKTCLFAVAVWALKSAARLMFGCGETSKYLHRGPQSNIQYRGKLTANVTEIAAREAENYLNRNVHQITLSDSYSGAQVQALVFQRYIVINAHALRSMKDPDLVLTLHKAGTDDYQRYIVPRDSFVIHEDGDLAVGFCKFLHNRRDIFHKFMTDEEFERMEFSDSDMVLLSRFKNQPAIEFHPFVKVALKPTLTIPKTDQKAVLDRALILNGSTIVGKSGSTALFRTKQGEFKIAGIQAWSIGGQYQPQIAVQVITQEMLLPLIQKLDETYDPIKREAEYEDNLTPDIVLPGAFTSREFNNVIHQVPKEEAAGMIGKTQFQGTPIASFMDAEGYTSKRCPAVLNPFDVRLYSKQEHPLKHSLGKYFRGSIQPFDPKLLSYIRKGLGAWLSSKLDKSQFRRLEPHEIVTGTREDGSNPMNLTSSPGIPFIFKKKKKGKKDFFEIDEEGNVSYFDHQTFLEYTTFANHLRQRKLPLTRAYDFPKDELRPISKALGTASSPPKTRSVTCMNMFHIMAWREVTLDFWASMHRAADGTFPFCPGINPEGPEWSAAYHYLNKHPYVVDFDVSNWDGFLPADLLYLAGDIVADVSGLSQEDRNVVEAILFDVINCNIQYGRFIYQKSRGMVSGFPGTAEMNTLVHWILLLCIYLLLTQDFPQFHSIEAFRHHVSFLVYGDDIIISFSEDIKDIFNGVTIARTYMEIGYPVTSADKSQTIVEFKSIRDCQFLKSSWKRLFQGVYVRIMDLDVAYDLLYWVRAKEHPVQQFYSNVVDALRIVFGHGEKVFDLFVKRLNRWLLKAQMEPILYQYQDFYHDYVSRYYQIITW